MIFCVMPMATSVFLTWYSSLADNLHYQKVEKDATPEDYDNEALYQSIAESIYCVVSELCAY